MSARIVDTRQTYLVKGEYLTPPQPDKEFPCVRVEVTFHGAPVPGAYYADLDSGIVLAYARDANGQPVLKDRQRLSYALTGRVELRLQEAP